MATKLYFHDAASTLVGTLPSGEQSAATPSWTTTGGTTNRTMSTTIGAAQASLAGTSLNNTSAQNALLGIFISEPLNGAQTVGGGSIIFSTAERESSTNMNFWVNSFHAYIWRPSTGAKIGTIRDAAGSSLGGSEPSAQNSSQTTYITGITSTGISAADGDVIVVEVWSRHTQGMSTSYTGTFYYDGTTETNSENTIITSHASYIQFAETLTFQSPVTNIAGSTTLTFGASGSLKGSGKLSGTSALTLNSGTTTLKGTGKLAGSSDLVIDGTGSLKGEGKLSGNSDLLFNASAILKGEGKLTGVTTLTFSLSGYLNKPSRRRFLILT